MAFAADLPGSASGMQASGLRTVVRYRGFLLIPQADLSWLVRPVRSPMRALPFRTPASSLADVKALVDWRLQQLELEARPQGPRAA